MTLTEFLTATATVDETAIRRALVEALRTEVPRSTDGYARLYDRVTERLAATEQGRPAA